MASALALLLLSLSAGASAKTNPPEGEVEVALFTWDGAGYAEAGERWLGTSEAPVPLPFTSRAPLVRRALPTSRGIRLRLANATAGARSVALDVLRVTAVQHAADEQVLVAGAEPFLIGAPHLPLEAFAAEALALEGRAADGAGPSELVDALPLLARQDGRGVRRLARVVAPVAPTAIQSGATWRRVEIVEPIAPAARGARTVVALGGSSRTCRLDPAPDEVEQDGVTRAIDQLFWASVRSLESSKATRLAPLSARMLTGDPAALAEAAGDDVRDALAAQDGRDVLLPPGAFVDLLLPAPPLEGGESTWTLVIELGASRAPEREGAPTIPAGARPERDRGSDEPWIEAGAESGPGVDFLHFEGPDLQLDIRPTMGPGAAWGDVDGDGDHDLYVVQGGGRAPSRPSTNRLWRNESRPGRARFVDVTVASGTGDTGHGMGALFFDADGDGDLDLYVANRGPNVLYENVGAGRFADASACADPGDRWSAGVAAADTDGDGDLELYVTSYLVYDPAAMPSSAELARYQREDPVEMLPFAFPGARNAFLQNDTWGKDDGPRERKALHFTDVAEELGLADEGGRGMQPVFWDFDRDGDQDLYVANDVSYNALYRNEGDGTFTDVSFATGMDDPRGSMGVAVGDVDGDGDEDLFVTNWQLEPNALYANNLVAHASRKHRVASFRDAIVPSGLGSAGIGVTSWGAEFLDADNDGDLDLFYVNGYTSPDYESTGTCVGQPAHFFLNDGEGRFATAPRSTALEERLPSRAAVACDFDGDGDLDMLVTANNARTRLLENRLGNAARHHWLIVRLAGRGPNTHAIGALVSVTAGGSLQQRSMRAGTSYLGGNPPELHFGLGAQSTVEEVRVRWPSGRESRHAVLGVDRILILEEPE